MKVNMTPNPLDVVTIHASQGDTEARQWEFELHNNGELIDTSEVTEQMFFKAYKGGTEQLLPENGSTPTTSPFKGDIRYPQGLLTNQKFTYRQSPTEEDGLVKVNSIKGNTLVWNQIFKPQYRNQSGIQSNEIQDGNDYSVRIYGTSTANAWLRMDATGTLPVGHKFLLDKGSTSDLFDINNDNNGLMVDFSAKTKIGTVTTADKYIYIHVHWGTTIDITVKPMLIDLTQMGLDSLTDAEILQWFATFYPLPYYSYNQGSLLSFMGNGIKTVGFNQWDEEWEDGSITGSGVLQPVSTAIRSKNFCPCLPNTAYYLRVIEGTTGQAICWYDSAKNFIIRVSDQGTRNAISPSNASYFKISLYNYKIQDYVTYNNDVCLNISDALKNGIYEPYTSSTLSLPISTYFPNGMKSAGNVYDELTENKAITRIGMVNLGDLNWSYSTNAGHERFNSLLSDAKRPATANDKANLICAIYENATNNETFSHANDKTIAIGNTGQVYVYDSAYTDATAFKTAMSGVYLYYELATESETSFTTASLVTENAEIPLSNNDGVLIGKCTEQLSENPGFIDAKIKLSDSDGTCYSNKIQLHIERSPQ